MCAKAEMDWINWQCFEMMGFVNIIQPASYHHELCKSCTRILQLTVIVFGWESDIAS